MGFLVTWVAYGIGAWLFVVALLFLAHGLLQLVPGTFGNSARRYLFNTCYPWIRTAERILPVRFGNVDLTAFLAAAILLALCRFGIPWLVLFGFALKG
jgi:uncharacterized protein YggT (Ycf19 family)